MGKLVQPNVAQVYKGLKLIAPWRAEQLLNRPVEGPVFISPVINTTYVCTYKQCQVDYTPLVYALGERTVAQHVHAANGSGGLYVVEDPNYAMGNWIAYGLADDVFRVDGLIKCRMFLMQEQPKPAYTNTKWIVESTGGTLTPREYKSEHVVGTVDDEGNMSFPLETWKEWVNKAIN